MIVVDTNIVCYLLLEREKTGLAQALFSRDENWLLPPLWRHEFLNVLANYARHADTELAVLRTAWQRGIEYFQDAERHPDMLRALGIAVQYDISAYDAQFIALADGYNVPLISEDRRLCESLPDRIQNMADYLARE